LTNSATKIGIASIAVGATAGGAMMWLAWKHNTQCSIHCEGTIDWAYWLGIGGAWFVPVAAGCFFALWLASRAIAFGGKGGGI
jgi:hypothetical protein